MCIRDRTATAFNCAADFGNNYSLAAGVSAVFPSQRENPVVNTLLGNDASTISDIVTGRNRVGGMISEVLSNPSRGNVVAGAVRAVGTVPTGPFRAELGVNGAGNFFALAFERPTLASSILGTAVGRGLNVFTVVKAVLDATTYGIGLARCR